MTRSASHSKQWTEKEDSMAHKMSGIETRLYVRKSADHPVTITVERERIPRGGYILHFTTAGESSDVEIWLSEEHTRELARALARTPTPLPAGE
jgi:hypothetical protein